MIAVFKVFRLVLLLRGGYLLGTTLETANEKEDNRRLDAETRGELILISYSLGFS